MEVSESRIATIRQSGSAASRLVVGRLFDTGVGYRHWLTFHWGLMKMVAASDTPTHQVASLRKTSLNLVHRQALFEYLRESRTTGRRREVIFSALHGPTNYSRAVIGEHGRYLESNSSLFCADYLEASVMDDATFGAELAQYRSTYMQFLSLYCGWIIAEDRGADYPLYALIPEMKQLLRTKRTQLLAMPIGVPHAVERRRSPRKVAA
jgi:hypothetical protein